MRKLDLIIESEAPSSITYQRLNLNSVTPSDREHVDLGTSLLNGARTIEVFFTPSINFTSGTTGQVLISRWNPTSTDRIDVWFQGGRLNFVRRIGTTSYSIFSNANSWTSGVEYHVACVIDPINGMEMYIDGIKQTQVNASTATMQTRLDTVYLGGLHAGGIRYFEGKVRNLQVWNIARTVGEIATDSTTYYGAGTVGLIDTWHFSDETGATTTGENGNSGTISTLNAGGVTHIDTVIREPFTVGSGSVTGLETKNIDIYDNEPINVIREGIDVSNLDSRSSGLTNSFSLPATANNNRLFEFLDVEGNTSNFPYQDNYVRYIEDGVELIPKGRLNIKKLSDGGYQCDIVHGANDFFDRIRDKYLWEAYEPYRVTLNRMNSSETILTNDLAVQANEGYVVALTNLFEVSPIRDWQQMVSYFIDFGIEKIADHVGYTVLSDFDFTDYVYSVDPFAFTIDSDNVQFNDVLNFGDVKYLVQKVVSGRKVYQHGFDFDSIHSIGGTNLVFETYINKVLVDTLTFPTGGSNTYTYSTGILPDPFLNNGDIVEVLVTVTGGGGSVSLDLFGDSELSTGEFVKHENQLKNTTQLEFLKDVFTLFNLGVEVNEINKELSIYPINEVMENGVNSISSIDDLSSSFISVDSVDYNSNYGNLNRFKYNYFNDKVPFADGYIEANNTNREKVVIQSELTASKNATNLPLGTSIVRLTEAISYDEGTTESEPTSIGKRINKVLRFPTSPSNVVSVEYENTLGITSFIDNDQTILSFKDLDWNSLILNNYSNLESNILNRYAEYKVIMKTSRLTNKGFSFKDKVYIDSLGKNFVVKKITTLPSGLSEWILIRIN